MRILVTLGIAVFIVAVICLAFYLRRNRDDE